MSKSNSSQVKKLMDRGQVTRPRGKYQVGSIVKLTENNDWEMNSDRRSGYSQKLVSHFLSES